MIISGIDCGLAGAVCFYDGETVATHDMPILLTTRGGKNRREVDPHALADMFWKAHADHAFVEDLWFNPGEGFANGNKLKAYGIVIGVLAAVGVPYTIVSPQKWKKALQVPAAKDAARARASQLLPGAASQWRLKRDDGRAESACIAYFGLRQLQPHINGKDLLAGGAR